jgi:hypothetical protein
MDIFFGPKSPKGKEKNFIKTDPDKGFFVAFRFYGPLEGYIEKTWGMNDFGAGRVSDDWQPIRLENPKRCQKQRSRSI